MAGRVFVSTNLFPLSVLQHAAEKTCSPDEVSISEIEAGVMCVEFHQAVPEADASTIVKRFKQMLTACSIQERRPSDPVTARKPTILTLDISIQIRTSEDTEARVLLAVRCDEVPWNDLLTFLASVGQADITLETTWPADRHMVRFDLQPEGNLGDLVSQIIQWLPPQSASGRMGSVEA